MATPIPVAREARPALAPADSGEVPAQGAWDPARSDDLRDRFRSLFVIGRGGMGSVEVALDRCGGGGPGAERVVALKRLLPGGARDAKHREMFLREARLAALLVHPSVVHAFAFGELDGNPFLAMEYVEGEPLSRVLAEARRGDARDREPGGLDPASVALVLASACEGLHAAHELRDAGGQALHVVHRDVSPQNLMIGYDGRVKVLDFGVAKLEFGQGQETQTGEVKGKMAYMSPEQALGEGLDRRSDLYSVGAVLFECLTGRRMWGDGTDMEVMRRLALEEPPRLDDALPGVPKALVDLHARLVARDPRDRPATALEVAHDLRGFVAALPDVDDASLRILMHRLFRDEALRRRAQLAAAVKAASPVRGRALGAANVLPWPERPTPTEPFVVPAPPPSDPIASARGDGWSRFGMTVAVVVALAAGALGAIGAMRGTTSAPAAPAAAVSPPAPSASASAPSSGGPASPPGAAGPIAARPSSTAAVPPLAPTATTIPPPPAKAAPRQRPQPRLDGKPARAGGAKLPEVDPTPF